MGFSKELNKGVPAKFTNVLKGRPLIGDVYIERIPIEKVNCESEEALNTYLLDLYKQKVR